MKTLTQTELMLISGGAVQMKEGGFLVIEDSDPKEGSKKLPTYFYSQTGQRMVDTFIRDKGEKNQSLCIFGRHYDGETVEEGYFYRYNATVKCK